MRNKLSIPLAGLFISTICMATQCNKDFIDYKYNFVEKINLFPAQKSYNVGDTIWLQYTNPDKRLFDSRTRQYINADTVGELSLFNIETLEDSELLLLNKPSWDQLMHSIPKFERFFRIIIQNHLVATQRRLMQSLTETAEEKYIKFIQTYPDCLERVPQHMIASYLGITRETLSRLRKTLSSTGKDVI